MYKKIVTLSDVKAVNPFSSKPAKIPIYFLIVDDEEYCRTDIKKIIQEVEVELSHLVEFHFVYADNGSNGMKTVEKYLGDNKRFDIVTSDINMPILDGYSFRSSFIKKWPEFSDIPFVFISGNPSDTEMQIKAFQLGACAAIQKPIIDKDDPDKLNYKRFCDHIKSLIISRMNIKAKDSRLELLEDAIYHYVNKSLVAKILEQGFIDDKFHSAHVGIVFGDICDSSIISQVLTPVEVGVLFNGFYTLIYDQIEKYHGHFNKSMGDGFLMHFGGPLDKTISEITPKADIADKIIDFCISSQRALNDFNQQKYISTNPDYQREINLAYDLIAKHANHKSKNTHINMRLGACQGDVIIGDFGPKPFRQYDTVSALVNLGARLETKASPRGICLHQSITDNATQEKINNYIAEFKQSATGFYKNIEDKDIYHHNFVHVKGFTDRISTFSIEPLPDLPEIIQREISGYLEMGQDKIPEILRLIKLYLSNKLVLKAIDELFLAKNIKIRRQKLFEILDPETFASIKDDPEQLKQKSRLSLYSLLKNINLKQEAIEKSKDLLKNLEKPISSSFNYEQAVEHDDEIIENKFQTQVLINQKELELTKLANRVSNRLEKSLREYFSINLKE